MINYEGVGEGFVLSFNLGYSWKPDTNRGSVLQIPLHHLFRTRCGRYFLKDRYQSELTISWAKYLSGLHRQQTDRQALFLFLVSLSIVYCSVPIYDYDSQLFTMLHDWRQMSYNFGRVYWAKKFKLTCWYRIPRAASSHTVHFNEKNRRLECTVVLKLNHGKYEPAMNI